VVLLSIALGCHLLCNIFNAYLLIYCSFDSMNIVISYLTFNKSELKECGNFKMYQISHDHRK